jgi:hypothetical protein
METKRSCMLLCCVLVACVSICKLVQAREILILTKQILDMKRCSCIDLTL